MFAHLTNAAHATPDTPASPRPSKVSALDVFAALFAVSILSFIVSNLVESSPLELILTMAGTAACGFSWLLARALFRTDPAADKWPILIVTALIITGGLLRLIEPGPAGPSTGLRMASNLHSLLSSTVLLLAMVEIFHNYSASTPRLERRFRQFYAIGYIGLILISVIWLRGAVEGSWINQSGDQIRIICAAIALFMATGAWLFRRRNTLPKPKRRSRSRAPASAEEARLVERIRDRFAADALYLDPDLKLPDLARQLGEKDYKISQCITGPMGYRNFNHLVNSYRIEAAKRALADPRLDTPILTIALDVGFASVGPFNRAFKAETGKTPRAYRIAATTDGAPS